MQNSVLSLAQWNLPKKLKPILSLLLGAALGLSLQTASHAATYDVTTTADSGANSLRQAIVNSNGTAGTTDTITFHIASGVQTITLLSALPSITDPVIIDATTQAGYAGKPLIVLTPGPNNVGDAITLTTSDCVVKGLVVNSFQGDGIVITGQSAFNNTVQNCYFGIAADGVTAAGNSDGVDIDTLAHNNTIGGTTTAARNVISGNGINGIRITGVGTTTNTVQGNYIGTNAAGTAAVKNNLNGIIVDEAINNLIGGTTAGARNIVSGNGGVGVFLNDPQASGNTVQGNLIGTDVSGSNAIGNSTGVSFGGFAHANTIGGTTAAARNIISGNGLGIYFAGTGCDSNVAEGNYIGTNLSGTGAVPNASFGVSIDSGPQSNVIGGTTAGARNVISGNAADGVNIGGTGSTANVVEGNYIGTSYTGNFAVPNGGNGVIIQAQATGNTVGGTGVGAGNLISGNTGNGVQIWNPVTNDNDVFGNLIGTNAAGTGAVPNTQNGVLIDDGAANNSIGGVLAGQANRIGFNKQNGIAVTNFANNDPLRGNAIFANVKLGIDLDGDGVTPNDSDDSDSGGNNLQNFPTVTSVTVAGGMTTIKGTLTSTASTTFDIDLYRSGTPDPSGFGEAETYVGSVSVTTDATGTTPFSLTVAGSFAGQYIAATATDPSGNTSEFGRTWYNIIGRITTPSSVAVSGITVNRTGSSTASAVTNSAGYFTFTKVPVGSYTLTPTSASFIFSPVSRSLSVSTADAVEAAAHRREDETGAGGS
jgi:hypothetical protein